MPKDAKARDSAMRGTLALMAGYLSARKARVAALAVVVLSASVLRLVNPRIIRSFIDAIPAGAALSELYGRAGLFIALAIAAQLLSVAATWLGQDVGWMSTNALRLDLLRSGLSMDMAWHKDHAPGELIERIDGDAKALMGFFSDFSIRLAGGALLLVGVLASLYLENAWIGLAMTGYAAFAAAVLIKIASLAVPWWKRNREKSAEFYGFLGERLSGREDLRSLGAGAYARRRLHALLAAWYPLRRKANLFWYGMWTSSEFVAGIGLVLSLGLGALFWRRGAISLGTVFLVYKYAELVRQPLEQLRDQLEELQKAMAGAARIREMLSLRPGIAYGGAELGPGAVALEFRDASFSYVEGETILRGLSFSVERGGSLGIAGRTGSGKTSLGRLALRLYECDEGLVLLDGRPIAEYSRLSLRRRLAVVTQEVELFAGSVRDNVRLWDPSIGDGAIRDAFGELGLDGWLASHPDGLDARIGSGGDGLSAGQAQLLAMVRVFLRDPGLLVLDEASSRLDPATEGLIGGALGRLIRGRTALIIAHRLSTLERTDRVLVMDGGRIAELGDRASLAADPRSRYHRLLRAGSVDGGAA